MPNKDEYLYMDDGGHGTYNDITPEIEEVLKEIDEKVKDKFPDMELFD